MAERRSIPQMVVLAFASAVLYGGATRKAPLPQPPANSQQNQSASTTGKAPAKKPAAFNAGERLIVRACGADWVAAMKQKRCGGGVNVLIVSLPDPYDSHLDWSYDADLEAVRRAVESNGYVIDRFELARPDTIAATARASFHPSGASTPRRALEPGVMLFRPREWGSRPLLLVYLIGEVPTFGIHKEALLQALAERKSLLAKVKAKDTGPRLVMPVFSGSIPSLAVALSKEKNGVLVATGSASDPGNRQLLATLNPNIRFVTTINTDAALDAVRDSFVLRRLLRNQDAIAVLTESGTTYGTRSASSQWIVLPRDSLQDSMRVRVITVPFPLNIADFRARYQKKKPEDGAQQKLPSGETAEHVNLDLNAKNRAEETPASVSEVTPASIDALMHEILTTLRRNEVRAVVLHATDVRDKLFLAEVIRQELKDVQLITYESNALFGRSEFNRALRGMVVLSSYPIILENQDWTDPSRSNERVVFPSETAEGIYNAVLVVLNESRGLIEYTNPADPTGGYKAPPVWITAVGAHSMLPVATRRPGNADSVKVDSGVTADDHRDVGFVWPVAILILISLSIYTAIVTMRGVLDVLNKHETREWREGLERQQVPDLYIDVYAILSFFAVFILMAPILVVLIHYTTGTMKTILLRSVWVGLSVWFVAFLFMLSPFIFAPEHGRKKVLGGTFKYIWEEARYGRLINRFIEVGARFVLLLFGIALLWCTILYLQDIARLDDHGQGPFLLFAYRALQMDSGLSPILPIMLVAAGLYAWCTFHRQRVRELRESTALEEMLLAEKPPLPGLETLAAPSQEVRHRLVMIVPFYSTLLIAAVLIIIASMVLFYGRGSLEWLVQAPRHFVVPFVPFDIIFRSGLIATLCSGTWAVLRLLVCWRSLQRFLTAISETRLAMTLTALPAAMRRSIRPSLITINSQQPLGRIANQQWQTVALATDRMPADVQEDFANEIAAMKRNDDVKTAWWKEQDPVIMLSTRLAATQKILGKLWQEDPRPVPVNALDGAAAAEYQKFPDSVPHKEWRKAAELFVAGQLVYYIDWAQAQLRRISYFLLIALLIGIALVSSYPFQPQSIVKALLAILIAIAIGSIVYVTSQMNKDPVLSTIAGTDAGVLNWNSDFILNIVLYVVVPVLTLLSSEIPFVRNVVFSWAEPLFRSLAKF